MKFLKGPRSLNIDETPSNVVFTPMQRRDFYLLLQWSVSGRKTRKTAL